MPPRCSKPPDHPVFAPANPTIPAPPPSPRIIGATPVIGPFNVSEFPTVANRLIVEVPELTVRALGSTVERTELRKVTALAGVTTILPRPAALLSLKLTDPPVIVRSPPEPPPNVFAPARVNVPLAVFVSPKVFAAPEITLLQVNVLELDTSSVDDAVNLMPRLLLIAKVALALRVPPFKTSEVGVNELGTNPRFPSEPTLKMPGLIVVLPRYVFAPAKVSC